MTLIFILAELRGPQSRRGHPGSDNYSVNPRRMIILGHTGNIDDGADDWRISEEDESTPHGDLDDHEVMELHDDSESELDSHLQDADDEHRNAREDTPGPEPAKSQVSEHKTSGITDTSATYNESSSASGEGQTVKS